MRAGARAARARFADARGLHGLRRASASTSPWGFATSTMPDAPKVFYLEDEPDATHGSDSLDVEASVYGWFDGAAFGLCERGSDRTGSVYPSPGGSDIALTRVPEC